MRKRMVILLVTLSVFSLAACGNSDSGSQKTPTAEIQEADEGDTDEPAGTDAGAAGGSEGAGAGDADQSSGSGIAGGSKVLIAYFSVMETDGMDTVAGASRVAVDGEVLGNNEYIAELIQKETKGDLFAIETVQEYPTTHDPLLEFAYKEKSEDARPELASQIEDPDSYDVIFLGFPNWNADLPMPLYSFLEAYDFAGKTIIPFTTHGGSGFSRTIQTIASLQPEADVVNSGLSISRNSVPDAQGEVADWVNGLGLATE